MKKNKSAEKIIQNAIILKGKETKSLLPSCVNPFAAVGASKKQPRSNQRAQDNRGRYCAKGFTQTVNDQLTTRKTSKPESVAAAHSRIQEHREPEVDPALHPIKQATETEVMSA